MSWDLEELRERVRATERKYSHELEDDSAPGWVDLHCHVLPEVDDGAESLQQSLQMLHQAWESGTREIIATPHMFRAPFNHADVGAMGVRFAEFVSQLRNVALNRSEEFGYLRDLKIQLGAENYVSPEFLQAVGQGDVQTLGQTQCVLIEFPDTLSGSAIESAAKLLLDRGFTPVLAHVERVGVFTSNPEALEELIDIGAVAQVNLGGLLAPASHEVAAGHIQSGRARLVASDAHDTAQRSMRLDRFKHVMGPRRLRTLLEEAMTLHPRRMMERHRAA